MGGMFQAFSAVFAFGKPLGPRSRALRKTAKYPALSSLSSPGSRVRSELKRWKMGGADASDLSAARFKRLVMIRE